MSFKYLIGLLAMLFALGGCVAPHNNVDYTAFRESRPASILVLPPLNDSVDVEASAAVLAQATQPLAESGYYVTPVAVMDETFKQNGLTTPDDIHGLPSNKLREIFGADAALYMTVKKYGSSYAVISSSITVAIDAALLDLRTGAKLWEGSQKIVHAGNSSSGLAGMLVQAMLDQVVNTLTDKSYKVAGVTNQALLSAGRPGGMLFGPRSPHFDGQ
jgi:hypothetical protein